MNKSNSKLRIGIIGAGASGLTSAWLLDGNHDVTIFEKEDRLGGHVCTVPITIKDTTIPVDAGAEFFSDAMFSQFNKLLQILNIRTHQYPLTYTFYHPTNQHKIILPSRNNAPIFWKSLSAHAVFDLTQLHHFVNSANHILATEDTQITLSEYADTLMLTEEFKEHFLYPFFAASWGVSPQDIKNFAAYDIIKWAVINKSEHLYAADWKEIIGGMSMYINALVSQLKNTTIIRSAEITDITYENNQYFINANEKKHYFDHIIIATNAMVAKELIKNIAHAQQIAQSLGLIEYFRTTIAIHGDQTFMPQDKADWSIANIRYDGRHSALTICKPRMQEAEIFRSWITFPVGVSAKNAMPNPLYYLTHFYHPKVTPAYFAAQKKLQSLQGNQKLWIAGFYTQGIDSHNSAICSAITIAQKLAPGSLRLAQLTKVL